MQNGNTASLLHFELCIIAPLAPSAKRAVQLSREPDLFGILSEPVAQASPAADVPAILLVNAGSAYRVGPNRLHVLLAGWPGAGFVVCAWTCMAWETASRQTRNVRTTRTRPRLSRH